MSVRRSYTALRRPTSLSEQTNRPDKGIENNYVSTLLQQQYMSMYRCYTTITTISVRTNAIYDSHAPPTDL